MQRLCSTLHLSGQNSEIGVSFLWANLNTFSLAVRVVIDKEQNNGS